MFVYKTMFLFSLLASNSSFYLKPRYLSYNKKFIEFNMKKERQKNIVNIYLPKTYNQQSYLDALNNDKSRIVVVSGPAGTGKTMFGCLKAIDLLKSSIIDKIIITRPVVTVEEDIGFLPGNIVKKMDPWTKPVFDLFLEHYSKSELDNLIYSNTIEICPLAFMRGRTFKNAFIIADEMQNSSPNQMKMLTTRIGFNTKMVITGDVKQSDTVKENGLVDFINKIKLYENNNNSTDLIQIVELDNDDIERSEVVKKVIKIYDNKE